MLFSTLAYFLRLADGLSKTSFIPAAWLVWNFKLWAVSDIQGESNWVVSWSTKCVYFVQPERPKFLTYNERNPIQRLEICDNYSQTLSDGTYLHNFGQNSLVKMIFQCWSGKISFQNGIIFIQVENTSVIVFLQELVFSFGSLISDHFRIVSEFGASLFFSEAMDSFNF